MKYLSPTHQAEFRKKVWDIVRQIPEGRVMTYGNIAALIPPPKSMDAMDYAAWSARWVGGAMAACPGDVPWQRVNNSQGKISLRPESSASQQRQLLESEGVEFDSRGKIDLKAYAWVGPSIEWLQAHGLVLPGGS